MLMEPHAFGIVPSSIAVTFSFDDNNAVKIHYECVPDRKTALNVTNHSYFNLEGFDKGPVTEHVLQLFCDAYTPTDAICIPTGEIRPVSKDPAAVIIENGTYVTP